MIPAARPNPPWELPLGTNPQSSKKQERRALFIVITDYPGGAERVAFGAAAELASRLPWKVEVKIVCAQLPDSFSAHVLPPNVRVRYGPTRNWFFAFPWLPFRLLFRRYDLVFTTHIYTNALLSVLRRWRLIRTQALVVRESTSVFDRSQGWKGRLFGRLYRTYGEEDLVVSQTNYMADHIRPWLPPCSARRIHILPNPVDSTAIERASLDPVEPEVADRLSGQINVLFCGRLIEVKRPDLALEAFRLATDGIPRAQLVCLGDGALEDDLRRQAAKAGLAERVLFLGFRMNPFPVMAACRYGLVTSAREGFPNVILEMMACGLRKIFTTPCAGDLDRLEGVEIMSSFDPREIGAALRRAIDSGEDSRDVYRAYVRSRSIDAYLDAVFDLARANRRSAETQADT